MLDNFFSLIATINIKQYNYGSIINAIWINMHQPSQDIIVNLFTKSTRTLQKAHPLQVQAHPHDSAILLWRMDRGGSAGVPRAVSSPRGPLAGMPWVSCPRIDDLYLKCLRVATLWPSRQPWPSGDWRGAYKLLTCAITGAAVVLEGCKTEHAPEKKTAHSLRRTLPNMTWISTFCAGEPWTWVNVNANTQNIQRDKIFV